MERLLRWREPATVVVLVAVALNLVVVVVAVFGYGASGAYGSVPRAALALGYRATDALGVVVLAALVGSCVVRPRTPNARALTLAGLVVTSLAMLASLALLVYGMAAAQSGTVFIDLVGVLASLIVPGVAVAVQAALLQAQPRGQTAERGGRDRSARASEPLPAPAAALPGAADVAGRPDPGLEPTWQPDLAAGAAWHTAGEAASGAPAAGWGQPGATTGWEPAQPPQGRPRRPGPDGSSAADPDAPEDR